MVENAKILQQTKKDFLCPFLSEMLNLYQTKHRFKTTKLFQLIEIGIKITFLKFFL